MTELTEVFRLWVGSVVYRPYVYIFFICFLGFAVVQLGPKRTVLFTVWSYLVAFLAEYSSTRNGIPFGLYTYIDTTRVRELWLSNVPFWDSLSFVFLSYFSFIVAGGALDYRNLNRGLSRPWAPVLGGLLMMLLDVVIDPVALRGDKWFLGKVYFYPNGGSYFGVTITNFVGWFLVGFLTQASFQRWVLNSGGFVPLQKRLSGWFYWGAFVVFSGVFAFNLAITFWIREYQLAFASSLVTALTLVAIVIMVVKRARKL